MQILLLHEPNMDVFNIKQENRKKFQDKSKLKRHHKKNYSKVVRNAGEIEPHGSGNEDENKQQQEEEESSEDEYDINGVIIEKEGVEYEDVFDPVTGKAVRRRKKQDQPNNSNAFRYKDEIFNIPIKGLNEDEDNLIKNIDFKSLKLQDINDMTIEKQLNYKTADIDKLVGIEIGGSAKPAAAPHHQPTVQERITRPQPAKQAHPPHTNATPSALKPLESFLDELL